MANPEHLKILSQGAKSWNKWRSRYWNEATGDHTLLPELSGADLSGADLLEFNLSGANLGGADLTAADLRDADLSRARLRRAILCQANMHETNLYECDLCNADLTGANLTAANLSGAYLAKADLSGANLDHAMMVESVLCQSIMRGTSMRRAWLRRAILVNADLTNANITGAAVHGISAWDVKKEGLKQNDLVVTPLGQSPVTVDDLEVAQFIYLLLSNEKIRNVIDTIGKKGVLIIGRFTEDRKKILHSIRDELRDRHNLLPIMFEFDPEAKDPTIVTLSRLAHLSRFVIADLTDAKSVLQELSMILKDLPTLPVKPIIHESDDLPPMGDSFLIMQSMLKPYIYGTQSKLLDDLKSEVIDSAEECVATFEAQLADIRRQWYPWQQK